MMVRLTGCIPPLFVFTALAAATSQLANAQDSRRAAVLEEIIVTAQKREESLQEAPISIAAMSQDQLEARGITNLGDFASGYIPSLRIQPFPNGPSTLTITVRGAGFADPGQITFEPSVAIYLDDVYMSRAQGLAMEVADLERVEVLRGPQGTLFGRNATGGAVRLVTKKPSGEFGLRQTFNVGNYAAFKSATHLDLPEVAGVRAKVDYLHSEKDGWVDNTAPGENDYGDTEQDAVRVALDWDPMDNFNVYYAYDWSDIESTQLYHQVMFDALGVIGVEPSATDRTRFPVFPLDPSKTRQTGHNLTLTWGLANDLTVKSITSYRDLEEDTRNNYAGALLFNGLIAAATVEQDQFSQEFQLSGESDRLKWMTGLYYFEESASDDLLNLASLDSFGALTGVFLGPISPPIPQPTDARRLVNTDTESWAAFGQASWTPAILDDRMEFTAGLRYTEDNKSGTRDYALAELVAAGLRFQSYDLSTESADQTLSVSFQWNDQINTYLRWANGYKAGGVSQRSFTFVPFEEENVENLEFGLKSELLDNRLRLNLAVFSTQYDDFQIGFADPTNPTFAETINALKATKVKGAELDLTLIPFAGLTVDLSYTFLDADQPDQPNPLNNNVEERFELAQSPRHAGSLGLAYEFEPFEFGVLNAQMNLTSTSRYAYTPKNFDFQDSYMLLGGRISLSEISLGGGDRNKLQLSLWGKNLLDEEYRVYVFPVGDPVLTIPAAYGEPRSYGIELQYRY